jgi:hypothetical protein
MTISQMPPVAEAAEAHHQHAGDDEEAQDHPEQKKVLEGRRGSRWMPRKTAGSAMRTMDASIVAMSMPSVVMKSAAHWWRSFAGVGPSLCGQGTASAARSVTDARPDARTVPSPPPSA